MTFARIAAIALTMTIAATFAADASAKGKGKQSLYGGSSYGYQQQTTQRSGKVYGTQSNYNYGTQSGYQFQSTQSNGKFRNPGKYNSFQSSYGSSSTQYYGGGFQGQSSGYQSQSCTPKQRYGKPSPMPYYSY